MQSHPARIALTLLFLLCPAAHAQPTDSVAASLDWKRFYPLAEGNLWEYEVTNRALAAKMGYYQDRVGADTLVGDTLYHRLERVRYDPEMEETGRETVLLRRDSAGVVHQRVAGTERRWHFAPEPDADSLRVEGEAGIDVGARSYVAAHVLHVEDYGLGYSDQYARTFAEDLGFVHGYDPCSLTCGGQPIPDYRLVYAEVGGTVYGESVVATATEPDVPAPARSTLAVYPNPSDGPVTVSLWLSAPCEVTIRLFDVAGREVRAYAWGYRTAGLHREAVDLGGLAAGLYLARLDAAAGAPAGHAPFVVR